MNTLDLQKSRTRFRKKLLEALKASDLPRFQKRRLKSTLSLKLQAVNHPWWELWTRNRKPIQLFPFSMLSPDVMFEWFFGNMPDAELKRRLLAVLNDLPTLVQHVLDATGERDTIYGLLRDRGTRLSNNLETRLSTLISQTERLVADGLPEDMLLKEIRKAALDRDHSRKLLGIFDPRLESLGDTDLDAFLQSAPSAGLFVRVCRNYLLDAYSSNLQRIRSDGPIMGGKASDFGDLMHLLYAPYVQLFRCDRKFGGLLRRSGLSNECIAASRTQLLEA